MRTTIRAAGAVAFALLPVSAAAAGTGILIGPYVNAVSSDSAKVLWVSGKQAAAGTVEVRAEDGTTRRAEAVVTSFTGRSERLHTAVLEGLAPSTSYTYTVRSGDEENTGRFHTAPLPGTREPFRFIVYGDTRTYPERHLSVSEAMAKEERVWFVALSGDLVSNGDVWEQWNEQFFEPARPFLGGTAFWPIRGNHEGSGRLYRELFALPGNELWYSFDFGNLHFVALDSEVDGEDHEAMVAWLEEDLAADESEWVMVSYHRPTYNVGGHASDWGADDVLPVLEKHEVDIVITGHSHLYERFVPIGTPGRKPLIHIVSGGGGAPSYEVRPSPLLEGGIGYSGLHFCHFAVHGNVLDMVVKKPDGSVLDEMSLVKTDGVYQPSVMKKAVASSEARSQVHWFRGFAAEFDEGPEPGSWTVARIALDSFPPDARVTAHGLPWWRGPDWKVRKAAAERAGDGLAVEVRAPKGVALEDGKLSPPLELTLRLAWNGSEASAPVTISSVGEATQKRLTPAPEPVGVIRAPGRIVVDGETGDWTGVPALPERRGGESTVRVCWADAGLYGLAECKDEGIAPDEKRPWSGDSLHVFIERDFARSTKRDKSPHALVYCLSPGAEGERGDAALTHWEEGQEDLEVPARWVATGDGYRIEFLVPASALAPAAMEAGTVLGFNFAQCDGGAIRQSMSAEWAWDSPFRWGAIRLSP